MTREVFNRNRWCGGRLKTWPSGNDKQTDGNVENMRTRVWTNHNFAIRIQFSRQIEKKMTVGFCTTTKRRWIKRFRSARFVLRNKYQRSSTPRTHQTWPRATCFLSENKNKKLNPFQSTEDKRTETTELLKTHNHKLFQGILQGSPTTLCNLRALVIYCLVCLRGTYELSVSNEMWSTLCETKRAMYYF